MMAATVWTAKLARTVKTAMRMLDNVVDINFYPEKSPTPTCVTVRWAWASWASRIALHLLRIPASDAAVAFADQSMEQVCFHAYWASAELAGERGRYHSFTPAACGTRASCRAGFAGNCWHRSAVAIWSVDQRLDWDSLRPHQNTACATPTASRLHRPPPLPTSSAYRHRLNRPTRTCSSNPTCRASSPWSTSIWLPT